MTFDPAAFGVSIRQRRQTEGRSLRELANHLGVTYSSIARVESASHDPSVETFLILSRWLGKPIAVPTTCPRCAGKGVL